MRALFDSGFHSFISLGIKSLSLLFLFEGLPSFAREKGLRQIPLIESIPSDARLHSIDFHPVFKSILYQGMTHIGEAPFQREEKIEFLDFEFEPLTLDQFNFLKETYSQNTSELVYVPIIKYWLSDFLPPNLSAMIYKNFLTEGKRDAEDDIELLEGNCWNTVYEFLRGDPLSFSIYLTASRDAFIDELVVHGQGKYLDQLDPSNPQHPEVKFGDILLAYLEGTLQHAAIYIDKGIWYEKTGNGSQFAYRITKNHPFSNESQPVYRVLRVQNRGALRHPTQIFTSVGIDCKRYGLKNLNYLLYHEVAIDFDRLGFPIVQGFQNRDEIWGKHLNYFEYLEPENPDNLIQNVCREF